jgi:hypothetical protein
MFTIQNESNKAVFKTHPLYFTEYNDIVEQLIQTQLEFIKENPAQKVSRVFCLIENLEEK